MIICRKKRVRLLKHLLMMGYKEGSLWYIRTSRKKLPQMYGEDEAFELGKGKVLRDGKDAVIMSYGVTVAEAYQAARELAEQGIEAAVVDMFSISHIWE